MPKHNYTGQSKPQMSKITASAPGAFQVARWVDYQVWHPCRWTIIYKLCFVFPQGRYLFTILFDAGPLVASPDLPIALLEKVHSRRSATDGQIKKRSLRPLFFDPFPWCSHWLATCRWPSLAPLLLLLVIIAFYWASGHQPPPIFPPPVWPKKERETKKKEREKTSSLSPSYISLLSHVSLFPALSLARLWL